MVSHILFLLSSVLLLCSLVVLLNRIYLIDPYFDTHRDSCSYVFLYSIRTLKFLFEDYSEVNSTISECLKSSVLGDFTPVFPLHVWQNVFSPSCTLNFVRKTC